jgi:hypothetical protein
MYFTKFLPPEEKHDKLINTICRDAPQAPRNIPTKLIEEPRFNGMKSYGSTRLEVY